MSQSTVIKAEKDPAIFKQVRDFLHVLNSGGGTPIEELAPLMPARF